MQANIIDLGSGSPAGSQVGCLPTPLYLDGVLKLLLKVGVKLRDLPTWENDCPVWVLPLLPLGVCCGSFCEKKGEVIPSIALEKQVMCGVGGGCVPSLS